MKLKKEYKLLGLIVVVIIIVGVIFLVINTNKRLNNQTTTTERISGNDISSEVKDITEKKQGSFELSDISIVSSGAMNIVKGKIKNSGANQDVTLQLKMYNSTTGRLMGSSDQKIEKLGKDAQEFEISIIGDYKKANEFKVIVVE